MPRPPSGLRWRTFEAAREYVQRQEFSSRKRWKEWLRSGHRLQDIPTDPARIYKDKWVSWGDWLGTGTIALQDRIYLPFEEARIYARHLELKTKNAWVAWAQTEHKPDNIPGDPRWVYRTNWVTWGDWLGTGAIQSQRKVFLPFEEARSYAQAQKFPNIAAWNAWTKTLDRLHTIPVNPAAIYKTDWVNWGDWLGTGTIAPFLKTFLPFEAARAYVHTLHLTGKEEWEAWCSAGHKQPDIPRLPNSTYKNEWISWGDWLGTGTIATKNRRYRPFDDARRYVRALHLAGWPGWKKWSRSKDKPDDIPANPILVYHDDWRGIRDWTGYKSSNNDTGIEREVKAVLDTLQISYSPQKMIGKYRIDIFISPSTCLECDGTYWHNRPGVKESDARRDVWLQKHGYTVVRLTEENINANATAAVKAILHLLGQAV